MLSPSGARRVQGPGPMRCELHTSRQPLLFWLLFPATRPSQGWVGVAEPCFQKPNPACQISLQVT